MSLYKLQINIQPLIILKTNDEKYALMKKKKKKKNHCYFINDDLS
jgi:hypothetical protein